MVEWVVSRNKFLPEQVAAQGGNYFYFCGKQVSLTPDEPVIIIDGYVIPRLDCQDECEGLKGAGLVRWLMQSHSADLILRIKGIFTLLIIKPDGFEIYNDIHGMGRYFIWERGNDFIISNSIEKVRNYSRAAPDYENMALYCLTEHFVMDMTAFQGVKQSAPASRITFDGAMRRSLYWEPMRLFNSQKKECEPECCADRWVKIIKGYISEPGMNTTLTLTGGSDSRLVLAGLMKSGAKVSAFTYGDPRSADALVAKMVAERLGIDHAVHFADFPSPGWLGDRWHGIISIGNTLVNLHRAHRYHAAEEERKRKPEVGLLFTGLMGGEYLRGPEYDGYIISEYFRKVNHGSPSDRLRRAMEMLAARSVDTGILDTVLLSEKLEQLSAPFLRQEKEKEFLLSFFIYGCAHHYQDSLIYSSQFRQVVNPFMDPDFLEMAAASDYISFNRSGRFSNLLRASLFQVQLTHLLLPELSDIPYSKRGFYTANDLTGNRLKYLLGRFAGMWRQHSYPPNFRYGEWMKDFAGDQLSALSPAVAPLFKVNEITHRLNQVTTSLSEREWHYYTNPLNLGKIFSNEKT
ncbi:MAG TPA: hypothetical protein DIS74_06240 [Bacteroidales bacterium]|nr:hypothetical protein [Bacteroidales bacterium]